MSRFGEFEQLMGQYEDWCDFIGKVSLVGPNMSYVMRAGHYFGHGIKVG